MDQMEWIEKLLNTHDQKIAILEKYCVENTTNITALCKSLDSLNANIKTMIVIFVTFLLGFFGYLIQSFVR